MSEVLCVVCPHVLANERPVQAIVHHRDGGWQAVCGERDHAVDCGDFRVVGLNHLIDRQANLRQFEALPLAKIAEQTADGWHVSDFDEGGAD